jgi:hypothetical protein
MKVCKLENAHRSCGLVVPLGLELDLIFSTIGAHQRADLVAANQGRQLAVGEAAVFREHACEERAGDLFVHWFLPAACAR